MALFRTLFWAAVFLAATFAFTVLFEHGPSNFPENAKKEMEALKTMSGLKFGKDKAGSEGAAEPRP